MHSWLRTKIFLRSNQRELKFILMFILYFVLGQVLYYGIQSHVSAVLVDLLHVDLSSKMINTFTPAEKTYALGSKLVGSGGIQIVIATGCEGIDGILLLIAAICAFKAGFLRKVLGLLAGTLTIYCTNITRIILLYYTSKYKPGLFDVMHIYFGQMFIILIGVLFFIAWTTVCGVSRETRR